MNTFLFWAHPRANLPIGQDSARTGLSACIFFACGKKGYRFNPLRVPYRGLFQCIALPSRRACGIPKAQCRF
jgi:hypothetical protein